MCEKSRLPQTKDVQHHASRAIGPAGNTAYNFNQINPNEILFASPSSLDEEKNPRSSASSQVGYSVSKNDLPPCTETPECHLPLNYQNLLAANSPSNSTMPSQEESLDSDFLSISDSSEQFEMPEDNPAVTAFIDNVVNKLLAGFRSTTQCQFSQGASGESAQCTTQAATIGSSTSSNNSGQPRKRRRAPDDNDDADQDGSRKPPNKKPNQGTDKEDQKSFACPYLKMDPIKYRKCCEN